ncbi:hypothetical protein V1478_006104 [Vespula squamosa]|uniref:Uncharacterized protein n=1 Tax=Vespula squamosa TaxID=30214 RepID=A0ABD2B6W7_VESSQ
MSKVITMRYSIKNALFKSAQRNKVKVLLCSTYRQFDPINRISLKIYTRSNKRGLTVRISFGPNLLDLAFDKVSNLGIC